MSSVVDGEVKSVNVRAGRTCLCVVVSVGASFRIRVIVPSVLLTCSCLKRCIVMLVNSEVQSVSAGTTVSVIVVVSVYSCGSVSQIMPGVLFTDGLGFGIVGAVDDG